MEVDVEGYERLTRSVRALLGIDLAQYKPAQVWRRVNAFANARGFGNPDDLLVACRTDMAVRTAFRDMITINVSEYFRNPEAWEVLRSRYVVPLSQSQGVSRVWSAGCSLGFEPYTIAMLFKEQAQTATVRILATDIDEAILNQARASRYTEAQMVGLSPQRRARFFRPDDHVWEVRPELRALVTFRRHDLLKDSAESGFDIIACRNVVIYFTEPAKAELYKKFAGALRPGGVLFIGATESIANARAAGLVPIVPGFYERPTA
jgi:chemotaxis protein methyltransferase CheR